MVRGVLFAVQGAKPVLEAGGGAAAVIGAAGDAWAAKAGGTSGVLWGSALRAFGDFLGDQGERPDARRVAAAVRAGSDRIAELGKAKVGDKTMLDALVPFADELERRAGAGADLAAAWAAAAQVATDAAEATAQLRPQVGRARPLAERSVGTPDPGAVSMAMCLRVVGEVLSGPEGAA